jgi:sulfotransferase
MSYKTLHFISGLPRSGSTLLTSIFKQNPEIHGQSVSSLSPVFGSIHKSWSHFDGNKEGANEKSKIGILKSVLQGYHSHIDKPIILDRNLGWITQIGLLENILQRNVKIIVCVRNPAEILTSFEKLRKENPLSFSEADLILGENSSIMSRAYHYAGPNGLLGLSHRNLKDAVTMGYLDRLLFVDYNRFCSTPKAQMKRIYEFLELPNYQHDFEKIEQEEYNGLSNLYKIKPSLEKTTVNCVEYLGLELYEQYNREIFWTPWI